jgi:1-aminocyclopropane-1-carboxylate deaminase/D-cysteine desulfhydrase-like pyridoxal-dependent ACC family enzyme
MIAIILETNFWIKRDDVTDFLASGNKVRKLEFLLADAIQKGCDSVITIGGLQSNHCRSTGTPNDNFSFVNEIVLLLLFFFKTYTVYVNNNLFWTLLSGCCMPFGIETVPSSAL